MFRTTAETWETVGFDQSAIRCQDEVHRLGRLPMERRSEVAMGVERQADRAVAEQVLHDLWMGAGLQEHTRRRMAKVMHADMRKPSATQCHGKRIVHLARLFMQFVAR